MKLYLVSGFLGSGKTTAIGQACQLLRDKVRIGVITNDQGAHLVDSAYIRGLQVANREVTNGCFCCKYSDLEDGIRSMSRTVQPEIIFAEPVGSCTDLVATVVNPLIQFYPSLEIIVSVFADACLLLHQKNYRRPFFDEEVQYIYQKQLDEADVLIVNKIDLVEHDQLAGLKQYLQEQFPGKEILYQNSLEPDHVQQWLSRLQHFQLTRNRKAAQLDYRIYGIGEAKLGWLDEEIEILSPDDKAVDAAFALIDKIYSRIKDGGYPIGHLKFLMNNGQQKRKISIVSMHQPTGRLYGDFPKSNRVKLLINARVQAEPMVLKEILATAVKELKQEQECKVIERKMLAFKPGFPKPTHRIIS